MTFILIGMPGAGKSSIGREAAKRLKLRHIDTDRLIEKREGKNSMRSWRNAGRMALHTLKRVRFYR